MRIQNIGDINSKNIISRGDIASRGIQKVDFSDVLNKAIEKIDNAEKVSTSFDEMMITGELDNFHDAMIAAQKAEILFNFGLEVRTQVLDAYRELMRIQV